MILLDLLFPKFCLVCKKWGRYVCNNCRKEIEIIPAYVCPVCNISANPDLIHNYCKRETQISGVVSYMKYNKIAKKIVKAIKYQLIYDTYNELSSIIANNEVFRSFSNTYNNCYLQPIPLHPNRLKMRGFNQAEALAKIFSRRFQFPVMNSLMRIKDTKPQAQLQHKKQRLENIKGAFDTIQTDFIKGKTIILVDDVYTSGSTCLEAARILKNAKAEAVFVWSLVRD